MTWTAGSYATGNSYYNNDGVNCAGIISAYGNSGSGCVMIGWQDGMQIYNNNLNTTARPVSHNGWPIKYWANGFLRGVHIHDNTFIKSPFQGTSPWAPPDWDFAIEFFNVKGMEFDHNYVQGSADINYIYKDTYPYGLWVHHNTFDHVPGNYSHAESGLIFEFKAENVIVENNTINNVGVGISYNTRYPSNTGGYNYGCASTTGGCSAILNNIIRNNVFSNVYQMGGASGGIVVQTENGTNNPYMDNMQIYNNTFVAKSGQPTYVGIDFTQQNNGGVAKNISIRNNIFQGFSGGPIIANTATTQSNIIISHNDYYNNGSNTPVWTGSGVTISNPFTLIPGFVSSTDLHLQLTSQLIDKGINVGIPFNGSAPDLGAYETGSTGGDVTPPVISNISSSGISQTSATITWTTDEASDSQVQYGTTTSYGSSTSLNTSMVASHSASLTGLQSATLYHYKVLSRDASGNLATSSDNTFTTASASNLPPHAVASANPTTVTPPASSTVLSGSGSSDPDGNIVSYAWSQQSPTSPQATMSAPNSITNTVSNLQPNTTYIFWLTVTDNNGATDSAQVTVTVGQSQTVTYTLTGPSTGQVGSQATFAITPSAAFNGTVSVAINGAGLATSISRVFTTSSSSAQTFSITPSAAGTVILTPTNNANLANPSAVSYVVSSNTGGTVTYATWNPSDKGPRIALSNNNLTASYSGSSGKSTVRATIGKSSGKWYWEVTTDTVGWHVLGVGTSSVNLEGDLCSSNNGWGMWQDDGHLCNGGGTGNYNGASSNGSVIGMALDMDAGKLKFYRNNTLLPYSFSGISGTVYPMYSSSTLASSVSANFGATSFVYPIPSGFIPYNNSTNNDTTPPVISNISSSDITSTHAILNWTTDEASDSQVEYGTTTSYGSSTPLDTSMVTSHSVSISGLLQQNTLYHYRVLSRDASGNLATSSDNIFTTNLDNAVPTVTADPDQIITLPTNSITLTAVATDPDGYIASYSWAKISGGQATIVSPNNASTLISGLNNGNYTFRVTVADNLGATAYASVVITVNPDPSQGISIGSRVKTTTRVNIRSGPGTSYSKKGTQPKDSQGTVTDGPIGSWWRVNFDSGPDGWIKGSYIVEI